MGVRSRQKAAERRRELQRRAEAAAEQAKAEGRVCNGRPVLYVPAAQRDTDPYPAKWEPKPKYTKDKWGITLAFSGQNRKERRRNAR